jgi:hypothetical protein
MVPDRLRPRPRSETSRHAGLCRLRHARQTRASPAAGAVDVRWDRSQRLEKAIHIHTGPLVVRVGTADLCQLCIQPPHFFHGFLQPLVLWRLPCGGGEQEYSVAGAPVLFRVRGVELRRGVVVEMDEKWQSRLTRGHQWRQWHNTAASARVGRGGDRSFRNE